MRIKIYTLGSAMAKTAKHRVIRPKMTIELDSTATPRALLFFKSFKSLTAAAYMLGELVDWACA